MVTWVSWWCLNYLKERKKQTSTKANCVWVYEYRHMEQEGQGQGCAACFLWGRKWAGSDHRSTMSYCSVLLLPKSKINNPLVPHSSLWFHTLFLLDYYSVLSYRPVSNDGTGWTDRFFTKTHYTVFFFLLRPVQILKLQRKHTGPWTPYPETPVFRLLLPQRVSEGHCAIEKS